MQSENLCSLARAVIETEAAAVKALLARVDQNFVAACECLLACRGRIVVLGMGKSGHIGGKIAATLASTGSPAFFVHPGEASHGDLGMITAQDVVLALSNSGETEEILTLLPLLKRLAVPLITLTGNPGSTLAGASTVMLDVSVEKEACPLGLAPTASTTATLVMGDALAVALLESRGFSAEDFARSHPGGRLGRRLMLRVEDLMHGGERIPRVESGDSLKEALMEMSRKGLGMTAIMRGERVAGIYTDGDLRRSLDAEVDIHTTAVDQVMTVGGKHIAPQALAVEALALMEKHKITSLLVLNEDERLVGVIHLHDLLRAGV